MNARYAIGATAIKLKKVITITFDISAPYAEPNYSVLFNGIRIEELPVANLSYASVNSAGLLI